jgi:hypothetical protein
VKPNLGIADWDRYTAFMLRLLGTVCLGFCAVIGSAASSHSPDVVVEMVGDALLVEDRSRGFSGQLTATDRGLRLEAEPASSETAR